MPLLGTSSPGWYFLGTVWTWLDHNIFIPKSRRRFYIKGFLKLLARLRAVTARILETLTLLVLCLSKLPSRRARMRKINGLRYNPGTLSAQSSIQIIMAKILSVHSSEVLKTTRQLLLEQQGFSVCSALTLAEAEALGKPERWTWPWLAMVSAARRNERSPTR